MIGQYFCGWLDTRLARRCIVSHKPAAGHAYKLESSLDGKTWAAYGGHADVALRSPHVDLKRARARYLRVTILAGEPGLWEFRVYQDNEPKKRPVGGYPARR